MNFVYEFSYDFLCISMLNGLYWALLLLIFAGGIFTLNHRMKNKIAEGNNIPRREVVFKAFIITLNHSTL